MSDKRKLGVTAGSYLGPGIKFDNNWAGRYYIQQEDFTTSFLNAGEISGLGLLLEPSNTTRVGLTYVFKVDLKFKDQPSIHGAGPLLDAGLQLSGLKNAEAQFDFTLPNQVMLSAYHDLTPDLAIMLKGRFKTDAFSILALSANWKF